MQDVNLTATEQIPVAEQDVDNLQTVHDNLVKLKPDFNVPIEQFREDMKDDSKLAKIHSYIASKVPTFKVPFSEFKADMFGAPVAPATTPAPAAPTPAAAPNPLTPLAPEKQALPVNKVSAAESLHSRIPYVHIDEEGDTHQVIPSIPATDANPFKMPEAVDAVAPEAPRFPLQGEKSLIPIAPTPDQLAF